MPELLILIQSDLKQAMKDRDTLKVSTLRMLTAAIKQIQVDQQITPDDTIIIGILTKMVKQRQDSAKAYHDGARPELAQKEEQEIAILQHYLPSAMSETDIIAAIADAISQTGAHAVADMSKVMAILTPKLKGRADMGKVSQLVRAKLI
jgi:uncharacterized protein YqeY